LGINIHGVGRKRSQRWLGLLSDGHGSIIIWGEGTFLKGVGVSYDEALGNGVCSSGHARGLGRWLEFGEIEAFFVLGGRSRVEANEEGNGWTRVVEVGFVVTAVCIHVIQVGLLVNVGVEVADVGKCLCPSIKGVENGKRSAKSEISDPAVIKISVVDIGGSDPPSGIDNSVVMFVGCDVEVEDIVDG
jgi:hypothetical protein